jgi:uncharacterized protein (DUF2249 family)
MTTAPVAHQIDVRALAHAQRHATIFQTFRALGVNDSLEIVNDHDPRPLYYQFQSEAPGQFSWDYLQHGPDVFRVRITRLTRPHGSGSCCGSCGGA